MPTIQRPVASDKTWIDKTEGISSDQIGNPGGEKVAGATLHSPIEIDRGFKTGPNKFLKPAVKIDIGGRPSANHTNVDSGAEPACGEPLRKLVEGIIIKP